MALISLRRRSQLAVATVAGMAGTFGNGGLLIFSLLIGSLVATIGYAPFFVCLAVLDLVGAIILWTVVSERERREQGDYVVAGAT
jgi:ACS family hexuronate transporter-like MFS transporter